MLKSWKKRKTILPVTAVADAGRFTVQYVPPPAPPPGKIWVKAPVDHLGTKICPDLHLSPEMAEQLMDALNEGLQAYLEAIDHQNG